MLNWIYKKMKSFREKISEKGQGMVEYALILAGVALIAAIVLGSKSGGLRTAITNAFTNAKTKIDSAQQATTATQNPNP